MYQLNVLDTGAEERFDRITSIACKLFGVPIALVSLMDADRQWFIDELTGLSNRRGFLKIGNHIFSRCQREDTTFSLFFFDLDRFKHINDTYGHEEGDRVLKFFSNALLQNFRHTDVIARLGGDEFCVLGSGLSKKDTAGAIERLKHSLEFYENKNYEIQFSVGSIQYQKQKHQSLNDMLELADSKMYTDKKRTAP